MDKLNFKNLKHHIIKLLFHSKNNYLIKAPLKLSFYYWAINSLNIIENDTEPDNKNKKLDQDLISEAKNFLISCKNDDGGYGGNPGYESNIYSVYVAMQLSYNLKVLKYDTATISFIRKCFKNGTFYSGIDFIEDNRFLCCALVSLFFQCIALKGNDRKIDQLKGKIFREFLDRQGIPVDQIVSYIFKCYNRDGGFGMRPGAESHAGQVFCCVVSLSLMGKLGLLDYDRTANFLVFRQNAEDGGLSGRPAKKSDSCYSYWCLACLVILDVPIDEERLVEYLNGCFGEGFSYGPGGDVDLYHTAYSVLGLALLGRKGFRKVIPELGVIDRKFI